MVERNKILLVLAAALLGGCTTPQGGKPDVQLLQLAGLLPGHYDNAAQVEADMSAGRPPHDAVSVVIVPVDSLTVGEHAFYLQQSDSADPHHITVQRIFSLAAAKDAVVEAVWSLAEPRRWREGAANPELFSALQYPDLKLLAGCSLAWKKEGDKFTATNDMAHCHATPPEARGAVFAHWEMELTSDTLGMSERVYDPEGRQVGGREDEPFIRLRRTGN